MITFHETHSLWAGVRAVEATVRRARDAVEITAFGDPEPKYLAGPERAEAEVVITCDPRTCDVLMALLGSPLTYDPGRDVLRVEVAARAIAARAGPWKAQAGNEPLEPRPVRLITLLE